MVDLQQRIDVTQSADGRHAPVGENVIVMDNSVLRTENENVCCGWKVVLGLWRRTHFVHQLYFRVDFLHLRKTRCILR